MTRNKLLEGIDLQGVGGTIYRKLQVNNLRQSLEIVKLTRN